MFYAVQEQEMADKNSVNALINGRRWLDAKAACASLCKTSPDDPEAWFVFAGINAQLGLLDEVVVCCENVIALQPGNVAALYNLGVAMQGQGRHAPALAVYETLLDYEPRHALALANLGLAYRQTGELEKAERRCRQALELKPDLAEALNTLGLALLDQNKLDAAAESFQAAIRYRPAYAEAQYNLGLCHEAQGFLPQAREDYRLAIKARASYAEAHARLGALLVKTGDRAAAIEHYRQALEHKPDFAELYSDLATLLLEHRAGHAHRAAAERLYRTSLQLRPDSAEVLKNLALTLHESGELALAEAYFRRALELSPEYIDALAGLAMLLEHKGQFAQGLDLLRPVTEQGVDSVHVALAYAALARHFDKRAEAATMLERFTETTMPPRTAANVRFALGKLYDELKDYSLAFQYFEQANSIVDANYDESQTRQMFDDLIEAFDKSKIDRRPRASNRSRLPVFIVGMPRSGTSLLEQILASHPEVHGAGELEAIHQMTRSIAAVAGSDLEYPFNVDALNRKKLDQLAASHLEMLSRRSRIAQRITDKMPHNFLALGLIDQVFPGARIIHCMRDPADTCLSIYFQHFNVEHPYAYDLAALGKYYRQYQRLMAHWKRVLRIPIMDVRYEDMIERPEETSRAIIEFCDLAWDERCLRFYESDRITKTISYDQVRRPIYKKSVARWKNYKEVLGPLLNELEGFEGGA